MATDRRPSRIGVIGGGIAGLIAARDLAAAGADVLLLESSERLGGRIRREELDGMHIDIGAESFATRGGGVEELLADLGLQDALVRPAPLGAWVVEQRSGSGRDGAAHAVPLPSAGAIGIPAEPLSRASRRALGLVGALRASIEPLLPHSIGQGSSSVAELVRARLGRRVLDRLVRPVALGVYSADPADLDISAVSGLASAFARRGSLVAAAVELRGSRTAAGSAVAGLRLGMASLVDALTDELERHSAVVRLGAHVERILPLADAEPSRPSQCGWGLGGTWGEEVVDAVVLAVPERPARWLLGDRRPEQVAGLCAAHDRVEVIAIALDAPELDSAPRGTGALVASGDAHGRDGTLAGEPRTDAEAGAGPDSGADPTPRILAKALTHVTAKWPARAAAAGAGRHVLRLSYGRTGAAPETAQRDDATTLRIALRDASRILGKDIRPEMVRGMVRREWRIGHPTTSPPRTPPGIVLAGDWVSGTGIASVVPGARAAAEQALQQAESAAVDAAAEATATEAKAEATTTDGTASAERRPLAPDAHFEGATAA